MNNSRFETLLDRYQSGEATPAEVAALEKLLRADSSLRALFVEHSLLEAHLTKLLSPQGNSGTATPAPAARTPSRRFLQIASWIAVAAVVVFAVGIGSWWFLGRSAPPFHELLAGQVTVGGVSVGRIPEGQAFEVTGNRSALIRLADGSLAEVTPSSQAEVQSRRGDARQVVKLTRGKASFQVTHGGGMFRVETPVGAVTALGTAFSVNLRAPAKAVNPKIGGKGSLWMAVNVTDGSVKVDTRNKSFKLSGGDRRVFDDDGEQNNIDDGDQNNQDDGERGQALVAPVLSTR